VKAEQDGRLHYADVLAALAKLPVDQREALLLVTAQGMIYEEAARTCQTNLDTIKSRVNQARTRLAEIMGLDSETDFGPDRIVETAIFAPDVAR
jgi:RNA polymerase sigma-70 factor (ECF subfamily)